MKNVYVISYRHPIGFRSFITVRCNKKQAEALGRSWKNRGSEAVLVQTLNQWIKENEIDYLEA